MADFLTAQEIMNALTVVDIGPLRVEHTGGDVACIFAGEADAEGNFPLIIGGGVYYWGDPSKSEFYYEDFSVGSDPEGDDETYPIPDASAAEVAQIARGYWLPRCRAMRKRLRNVSIDDGCEVEYAVGGDPERFMLIELSTCGGGSWITTHESPGDAATYHNDQECPEYWEPGKLVDLDTGAEYTAEATTTWRFVRT